MAVRLYYTRRNLILTILYYFSFVYQFSFITIAVWQDSITIICFSHLCNAKTPSQLCLRSAQLLRCTLRRDFEKPFDWASYNLYYCPYLKSKIDLRILFRFTQLQCSIWLVLGESRVSNEWNSATIAYFTNTNFVRGQV